MLGVWILAILVIIVAACIFPWWFLPICILGNLVALLFYKGSK